MAEVLKILNHSVLRAQPSDLHNGHIILYFSPDSIDPADPTKFCRDLNCSWLQAKGPLTCTGPAPAAHDQVIAEAPYRGISIPVFSFSIKDLASESACGANVVWINNSRMARGG